MSVSIGMRATQLCCVSVSFAENSFPQTLQTKLVFIFVKFGVICSCLGDWLSCTGCFIIGSIWFRMHGKLFTTWEPKRCSCSSFILAKKTRCAWDGRDGSTGTQNTSTQCAWVVRIHIMCLGPLRDLYGTPRAPKRARFGPFGGPGGPWAAPGGLIWAQVPLVGPTGWAASISCARAPYETTTALLGPPTGPVLAQKGPFGSPGGPSAALGGLIWAQVPLVGPTGWAAFISCARAP